MAAHFDINVIEIGRDVYSETQLQSVDNVIGRAKAAFSNHGLPIGAVGRFHVNLAEVGALVVPRGVADERALGERWAVPGDAMDIFIVPQMTDPGTVGRSPRPGKCTKRATKGMRAPVVSLQEGDLLASTTFVHEIGHCLGLRHCTEDPTVCGPENFMDTGSGFLRSKFTPAQLAIMKEHCFVKP
jgi:hypothetical protein